MSPRHRHQADRELVAMLAGELDDAAAAALEARLETDPALRARRARLEAVWERLESPLPAPSPAFRARVVAAARRDLDPEPLRWSAAPPWVRAGATAALLLGVALGGLAAGGLDAGRLAPLPVATDDAADEIEIEIGGYQPPTSLAEAFWHSLEASDGRLGGGETGR